MLYSIKYYNLYVVTYYNQLKDIEILYSRISNGYAPGAGREFYRFAINFLWNLPKLN